jgi:hypothetical protein
VREREERRRRRGYKGFFWEKWPKLAIFQGKK